jgi:hypothetical protein
VCLGRHNIKYDPLLVHHLEILQLVELVDILQSGKANSDSEIMLILGKLTKGIQYSQLQYIWLVFLRDDAKL